MIGGQRGQWGSWRTSHEAPTTTTRVPITQAVEQMTTVSIHRGMHARLAAR